MTPESAALLRQKAQEVRQKSPLCRWNYCDCASSWATALLLALDHAGSLRAEVERLRDALRTAKIGLVGSLNHDYRSCNEGMEDKCFVCEGLAAVVEVDAPSTPPTPTPRKLMTGIWPVVAGEATTALEDE